MAPNISVVVFRASISGAYKISLKRYIDEEIQFLIDVFTENGHEKETLEMIYKRTAKPTCY